MNTSSRIVVLSERGRDTFSAAQAAVLSQAGQVTFHAVDAPPTPCRLARLVDGARVVGLTPDAVPAVGPEIIASLPASVRALAVLATGLECIDRDTLRARDVEVVGLPDYATTAVAEHTLGLLLTLSRRLHLSRDRALGRVPDATSVRGRQLRGKRLGVIGLGRIGRAVAVRARAFGMRVFAADPRGRPMVGVVRCSIDQLLAVSDAVTVHTSTNWQAAPLLGAAELARMRPGAWLVNTACARLVDEDAVVAAIDAGALAGYAVDDRLGPAVRARAGRLLREGRIVETDHTAWCADEAIVQGVDEWVDTMATLAKRYATAAVT